jgi:hypothetical protein
VTQDKGITGINDTYEDIIKIYPNPVTEYLSIQDYTIKIMNQLGTTVFQTKVSQSKYEINTSHWSRKGVYVLQVYDANNKIKATEKIILQ